MLGVSKKSKCLVIGNAASDFLKLKYELVVALSKTFDIVVLAAPDAIETETQQKSKALHGNNVCLKHIHFETSSLSPRDATLILKIKKFVTKENPDIVILMTIKPILAGLLAKNFLNSTVPFIAMFSGLGRAFQTDKDGRYGIIFRIFHLILKMSLRSCAGAIVQNNGDFQKLRALRPSLDIVKTNGTGVDLNEFKPNNRKANDREKDCVINIKMISRLFLEKGVSEFINAAKILEKRFGSKFDFELVGHCESDVLSKVNSLTGSISYKGHVQDVKPVLSSSDLVVLPSYYPEGVPRILIEAIAMGVPVITTNTDGCRDVIENENGFLVEARNVDALVTTMSQFGELSAIERVKMGLRGRELALTKFNVHSNNRQIIKFLSGFMDQ